MFISKSEQQALERGKAYPYLKRIPVGTTAAKSGMKGKTIYKDNPYYVSPAEMQKRIEKSQAESQASFRQQLADQASATQADIAKQLQIVQQEKSAVSKMQEEYTASLKAEADAKRKAQEEQQLALQTAQANQMRAGRQANLQIQPASQALTTGGTQIFKRRPMQFGGPNPYTSLAISSQL